MPKLKELLVSMEPPCEGGVVTTEHRPFPDEIRKKLEAELAKSAAQVIDLRRELL